MSQPLADGWPDGWPSSSQPQESGKARSKAGPHKAARPRGAGCSSLLPSLRRPGVCVQGLLGGTSPSPHPHRAAWSGTRNACILRRGETVGDPWISVSVQRARDSEEEATQGGGGQGRRSAPEKPQPRERAGPSREASGSVRGLAGGPGERGGPASLLRSPPPACSILVSSASASRPPLSSANWSSLSFLLPLLWPPSVPRPHPLPPSVSPDGPPARLLRACLSIFLFLASLAGLQATPWVLSL